MPEQTPSLPDPGKRLDPELSRILAEGDPDKSITVFLELRGIPQGSTSEQVRQAGEPATFPFAARREAIAAAKQTSEAAFGETYRKLKETGITMLSSYPAAVVVVEGTPTQLRRAVALDEVIGSLVDFELEVQIPSDPLTAPAT